MRRIAAVALKVTAIAVLGVIIVGGAVGIYLYTSVGNAGASSSSINSTTNGSSSTNGQNSSAPIAGYQDNSGQPQGAWADYLGFIPAGYSLTPHLVNANVYPCPSGMNAAQCTQFKATCGNGVCDPNESCATCPIDCGIAGSLTCDPYTGRAGSPVSVCQVHR